MCRATDTDIDIDIDIDILERKGGKRKKMKNGRMKR